MENASKALIIAGAILLSILLIGLGMMVYSKAKGTLDDTGIDDDTSKQVTVTLTGVTVTAGTDPAGKAPTTTLKVPTGYTYTVTSATDAGSGYINAITIARNGTK